jgi:hypothetical protein
MYKQLFVAEGIIIVYLRVHIEHRVQVRYFGCVPWPLTDSVVDSRTVGRARRAHLKMEEGGEGWNEIFSSTLDDFITLFFDTVKKWRARPGRKSNLPR